MATPRHSPGTFCWFECGTTDAAAAKEFYTKLFGWNSVDVPMPGDMGGHYTLLKLGEDDVAGLYQMEGPQFEGVPSHWLTYVTVDDVDASAERATSLGASIVTPPMDIPGVGRMACMKDPTGATFSMFELGEHPGTATLGATPGTFGWSELATRDTAAAKVFYSELFNWGTKAGTDASIEYTEFQIGDRSIGGMMAMTPQHGDAPPHWLPYVVVADCSDCSSKVEQLGGRVFVPPTHIPKVGWFSVFAEPSGAALAVVQLEEH